MYEEIYNESENKQIDIRQGLDKLQNNNEEVYNDLKIITLWDRKEDGDTRAYLKKAGGAERIEIPELGLIKDSQGKWIDKELNMGNKNTLMKFIKYCVRRDNYGYYKYHSLVLWDHGGDGGVCYDETDGDHLSIYKSEITSAVKYGYSKSIKDRADVLGFDVCSFGRFENAYTFKDSTNYLYFSYDIGCFVYHYWKDFIAEFEKVLEPKDYVTNVVNNGYMGSVKNCEWEDDDTVTALKVRDPITGISPVENLSDSLNNLGKALWNDLHSNNSINIAVFDELFRINVRLLGDYSNNSYPISPSGNKKVDIGYFATLIANDENNVFSQNVKSCAKDVLTKFGETVYKSISDESHTSDYTGTYISDLDGQTGNGATPFGMNISILYPKAAEDLYKMYPSFYDTAPDWYRFLWNWSYMNDFEDNKLVLYKDTDGYNNSEIRTTKISWALGIDDANINRINIYKLDHLAYVIDVQDTTNYPILTNNNIHKYIEWLPDSSMETSDPDLVEDYFATVEYTDEYGAIREYPAAITTPKRDRPYVLANKNFYILEKPKLEAHLVSYDKNGKLTDNFTSELETHIPISMEMITHDHFLDFIHIRPINDMSYYITINLSFKNRVDGNVKWKIESEAINYNNSVIGNKNVEGEANGDDYTNYKLKHLFFRPNLPTQFKLTISAEDVNNRPSKVIDYSASVYPNLALSDSITLTINIDWTE